MHDDPNNDRSFVFCLTGCLHTAIFADTIEAPYLRITPGHCSNIGEKDTLLKDRKPPKTMPYPADPEVLRVPLKWG